MDKIIRGLSLWREKYAMSSREEQFRLVASLFLDSPYVWGSENVLRTDCSGLVCGAFTIMGHPLRITATDLYKSVFTKDTNEKYEKEKVKAAFLLAKHPYDTQSGRRDKGTARHVGIIYGEDLLLHATYPAGTIVETIDRVRSSYSRKDCEMVFRELDWDALKEMEGEVYGLDTELI